MKIIASLLLITLLVACNDESSESNTSKPPKTRITLEQQLLENRLGLFSKTALLETPSEVYCDMANGEREGCYEFYLKHKPDDLALGTICPANLDQQGGVWNWTGENPGLYRLDRDFFTKLDKLGFSFYDEKGQVYSTNLSVERPEHPNTCISIASDPHVEMSLLIPERGRRANKVTKTDKLDYIGVSLSGVPIFANPPKALTAGHLPALDSCGGKVNLGGFYQLYTISSDINRVYETKGLDVQCPTPQDSSGLFGYAIDGFAIYGSKEPDNSEPKGLDECNGHVGPTSDGAAPIYHYHASNSFPNLPPCLTGIIVKENFVTNANMGFGAYVNEKQIPLPEIIEENARYLKMTNNEFYEYLKRSNDPRAIDYVSRITQHLKDIGYEETNASSTPKN